MKKNVLFVLLGASILLTMNACKSELDLDKELKFSKLSVEEQKQKIEQSGLDFIDAMEGLEGTEAIESIMHMLELSGAEVYDAPMRKLTSDIQKARKNAFSNFDRQMRASYVDSEVWGEYAYNFTTNEIDKVKSLSNKIIVSFPATESTKTNNAVITVTYEESDVEVPETGEMYPSDITFEMTVSGKEVMSAEFSGTYYSDGLPKKATQSLDIDDYSWKAEIENNKKKFSESYEFKKGSKTIIKTSAEVNGTLTEAALDDAIENESPEDAVSDFAVFFQVMDVAVKGGTTDLKAMMKEGKAIDSETLTEKQYAEKSAEILNKYMVCTAYFVEDNRKFADVELYVIEDEYTYYDYYLGRNVTEYDYYLAPRFLLSDGSKVDAAEYVEEGFDNIINKLEDLENDF